MPALSQIKQPQFQTIQRMPGARLMESSAGDQMALQIEVIVDGIVNRQKIAALIRVI